MELTEERKKFLQDTYGDNWEEVLQSGDLKGQDLTKLLMGDAFVRAYQTETNKLINNFLGHFPVWRGKNGYNADAPNSQSEVDVKVYNISKNHELTMIQRNIFYVNHGGKYSPITPLMMKHIIELDEMMRLSKSWPKPTQIYRGCDASEFEDGVLDGLNSTTYRIKTGIRFVANNKNGVVLDIEIPENFPAFSLYQVNRRTSLKPEQEIVLPPCDCEVLGELSEPLKEDVEDVDAGTVIKCVMVKVKPRSLARDLLEKMKNPPADYPRCYIEDPRYHYQEALKMLEEYVATLDKGIIMIGPYAIKEAPDPEIEIKTPEQKKKPDDVEND